MVYGNEAWPIAWIQGLTGERADAVFIFAELNSKTSMAGKSADIMDVNDQTVLRYLRRHKVRQLIHGHTHRPSTHRHTLPDGSHATRLVLPEWHEDHVTAWRDDGESLQPVQVDQIAPGANMGRRSNASGTSNKASSASKSSAKSTSD